MKKLLNFLLLISSFFGYLEWPPDNHGFIFQLETELFGKASTDIGSVIHPFILLPLAGQLLLLISLFQSPPRRWLILIAVLSIGILFLLFLLIGLLESNIRITGSTLPYLIISFLVLKLNFPRKTAQLKQHI